MDLRISKKKKMFTHNMLTCLWLEFYFEVAPSLISDLHTILNIILWILIGCKDDNCVASENAARFVWLEINQVI